MEQIRGANLGNWLVLEEWMEVGMFEGTGAKDEVWLNRLMDKEELARRMKAHRDSYVTEQDFKDLKGHGVNLVRIPVPFFVYGDRPPFNGCIEYLDLAFQWAEKYGLQVLIDLHTVPGSQNGYDNGGLTGVCKWCKDPEEVEFALTVLERLARRYVDHPALYGIEVLNEPISLTVWLSSPSGTTRTATYSHEIASATGRMMGNDGLWTDKGGQTGPGGNLHRTAFGGRNNEYCSEDSVLTTLHCADEIATMTEMGLGSACKHMAFNDQKTYRQGLACFFDEQAARENNLRAFEGAYVDGKPLYGMSSFSRFGLEPSSSYASFLTMILRDEWGWNGFVMTDMAHDYMPVVASVIVGTDQWCAFSNERYLPYLNEAELEANPELAWACREAAHRVMYMTLNSNAVNGLDSSMEVVSVAPWWQQALYGVDIALGVLAAACLILYIRSGRKDKKTSSAQ